VSDRTLVTSGPYERFFIQDGKRYHHILDVRTGYPAERDLQSVTIISRSSIQADALSTTVFAMGREGGEALLKTIPEVSAILVSDAGTIALIGPEAAGFEPTGATGYSLEEKK
jgi:thiamine biosynthesis lipoprotein